MIQQVIIKQSQKSTLWPTPTTSTSLEAGFIRGLVLKTYSPPCNSPLSASSDGCSYRCG